MGSTRKQDEQFFLLRVTAAEAELIDGGGARELTALEENVLDSAAWHTPESLEQLQAYENVFPRELPEYLRGWIAGWNGEIIRLIEQEH